MIYRAAAALPDDNRQSATDVLRGRLQIMAVAAEATPDWTTLDVIGPTETAGTENRTWFEWTASVVVLGVTIFDALPDPDAFPAVPEGEAATMPIPVHRFVC